MKREIIVETNDDFEECDNCIHSDDTEATSWIPVTENTPPQGTICLWCNKQGSVFASAITYRSERNSYVGKEVLCY